ncbi:hypothetical protein Tco_0413509 [Tanacetum coccineum]
MLKTDRPSLTSTKSLPHIKASSKIDPKTKEERRLKIGMNRNSEKVSLLNQKIIGIKIDPTKESIKKSDEDLLKLWGNSNILNESQSERMNKKDSSKGEEIKQESKEEVKEEDKGERTQERESMYKEKMKSGKKIQTRYFTDDPSDMSKENDRARLCLTIAPDDGQRK